MATIVITNGTADLFTMAVGALTAQHTKTYFARESTSGFVRAEMHYTEGSDLFNPVHFSEIEVDGAVFSSASEAVTALNGVIWLGSGTAPNPVPQIDIEHSGWICKDGTWQDQVTTYTDGVAGASLFTDSGIACDEPVPLAPIEPKVDFEERCDTTTGTLFRRTVLYTWADPAIPSAVTETVLSDVDTGIVCTDAPAVEETHAIVTGSNTPVPAGLKSVTINNITGNTTVSGGYVLGNGRRDNSISINATELTSAKGLLPAISVTGGVWQWIGISPITE